MTLIRKSASTIAYARIVPVQSVRTAKHELGGFGNGGPQPLASANTDSQSVVEHGSDKQIRLDSNGVLFIITAQ